MEFHHIGIACKDIRKEKQNIEKLHQVVSATDIIEDPSHDVRVCYLKIEKGFPIELVEGQPVAAMLKRGISYAHVCYAVEDVQAAIQQLTANGGILLSEISESALFGGKKVVFLKVSYGIIELIEK